MSTQEAELIKVPPVVPLKLDFGCGKNIAAGYEGVDVYPFEGVKHILNVVSEPWPWAAESVAEAHASHFIEHLDADERIVFFNELYRVLEWGAQVHMICPYWGHDRAFGDPTHKWPPIGGWFPLYLNRAWRKANAPHCDLEETQGAFGYSCDFDNPTSAYAWDGWLATKHDEVKTFAMQRYTNSMADIIFHLQKTKR
jgi:hypothetical protein